MSDLSQLSNDELAALYKPAGDLSGMNDDQIRQLHTQLTGGQNLFSETAPDWAKALHGATDTAARWATFGLTEPVSAAGRAVVQKYALGEDKPFSDLYQRNMAQQRGEAAGFAAEHPYLNAVSAGAGALASAAPAMGWPSGAGVVPGPTGLFRQMGQGAGVGMAAGGANALSESPNTDPLAMAKDTGAGMLAGGVAGAALPVAVAPLSRGISALARAVVPGAVDRQAAQLLAGRIGQDASAGGPDVAAMTADLAGTTKPFAPIDVAGENTRALGGRLARMQGEPRQIAAQFLNDRDAQSGTRLLGDVRDMISNGRDAFSTAQDLIQARATASRPLYDTALSVGQINDPAVTNLVQNSAMLRNTINSARANYPQYAQLPPNDMRLLDQAYKDIGGRADAARRSGDGALAHNLDTLRTDFRQALVNANPDYGAALQAFSGPSDSLRAIELGQGVFTRSPAETAQHIGGLSPADQDFFRLGAADAIRNNILRTSSGGNEARSIVGNEQRQQQLRPLFGSDAEFNQFIDAARAEDRMFQTRYDVLGNSRTAARVAEDQGGHGSGGALANLVAGAAALPHEPIASAGLLMRSLNAMNRFPETNNPQVNSAAARMLFSADPAANAGTLAAVLAGRAPVRVGATVPLGGLAGQLYPRLEYQPQR